MAKQISGIYGDAFFSLALEEDAVDRLAEEIALSREVFLENEDLMSLLNHPEITREGKLALVENAFRGKVSEETVGFFHVIIKKERHNDFLPIFEHFLQRVKRYKRIGSARVTSALELTDRQKAAVEDRLLKTTDYRSFEIEYIVKPEIIGGLIIRVDDRVVDSSLKTQIDTLTRQLSRIQLS